MALNRIKRLCFSLGAVRFVTRRGYVCMVNRDICAVLNNNYVGALPCVHVVLILL